MKKKLSVAAIAVVMFFSFLPSAFAIYQWVDEKGVVHITDYPKPGRQPVEEEKANSAPVELPAKAEPLPDPTPVQQPLSIEKKQEERKQLAPAPATPAPKSALVVKPTASALPQQITQDIASSAATTAQPVQQQIQMPGLEHLAAGQANMPSQQAVAAFVAAFALFLLAAGAVFYIYNSLCLFLIARKANVDAAWTAWIPIIQIWTFIASAGKPCWWVLLFFIPFVNVIAITYLWMCITENLGRGKALGLLMLIPVVNLILPGVLAFSGTGRGKTPRPVQAL